MFIQFSLMPGAKHRVDLSISIFSNEDDVYWSAVGTHNDFMSIKGGLLNEPFDDESLAALRDVFQIHGQNFVGDIYSHDEGGYCAPQILNEGGDDQIAIMGTDVCRIGGMVVDCDGHYLVAFDRILSIRDNRYFDSKSERVVELNNVDDA